MKAPLVTVAGRGDIVEVKRLLAAQPPIDINQRDSEGASALHEATLQKNPEIIRLLIEANADKDARDKYGATPLHYSTHVGNMKGTAVLLEAKADVNAVMNPHDAKGLITPLFNITCPELKCPLKPGHKYLVIKQLVDAKADVDIGPIDKLKPIHYLALEGNSPAVLLLHEAEAKIQLELFQSKEERNGIALTPELERIKSLLQSSYKKACQAINAILQKEQSKEQAIKLTVTRATITPPGKIDNKRPSITELPNSSNNDRQLTS